MSSGIDAAATARAAAMTKALRVGRTKGGDGMSVDSGANEDAIHYIGPRCAVIAPNVAPIGLSKPHVGPISPAATRRDARIPIVGLLQRLRLPQCPRCPIIRIQRQRRNRSTAGRPALRRREPGQVRKEAATAIHRKCRGNGSPPSLFAPQIDLILCCSPARTLMYVHVHCAFSRPRASSQADLRANSPRHPG